MAYSDRHVIKSVNPSIERGITTHCGETYDNSLLHSSRYLTDDPVRDGAVLCSKCSTKAFAAILKKEPNGFTLGERTDQSKTIGYSSFRSVYPVYDATGDLVAYIAIKSGWGGSWNIYPLESRLTLRAAREGAETQDPAMSKEPAKRTRYLSDGAPLVVAHSTYTSKEHALTAVPAALANGHIKSRTTIIAEEQAARKRWMDDQAEREREAVEREVERVENKRIRDEKIAHITEAFTAMCRTDSKLSNFERDAVATAAEMLGIKIPDVVL
jgi:hypothetical protein